MLRVYNCIAQDHNLWLVGLAALLCAIGVVSTFVLIHHGGRQKSAARRRGWLGIASLVAGFAIWGTHFVAMLAYEPGIELGYDTDLTFLSLAAPIAACAAAFGFARSQTGLVRLIAGAALGAGVAIMHFTGMAAFKAGGHLVWDFGLVAASILIGVAMGAAALWIGFRRDDWTHRCLGALGLLLAITGHHFTAMGAIGILPDPQIVVPAGAVAPWVMAMMVAGACVLLILTTMTCLLIDNLHGIQMQEQIVEQEQVLKLAVSSMMDGLVMFDSAERIVVVNDRYRELYGLSAQVVKPGLGFLDLLRERVANGTLNRDPESYRLEVIDAMASNGVVTRLMQTADGRSIDIVNKRLPNGGWIATQNDITNRVRHEKERKRARDFLETVIENVPAPILVKTASDMKYALVNQAAEAFLGLQRKDIIGKTVHDFLSRDAADKVASSDRIAMQSNDLVCVPEHEVPTPGNGARIVVEKKLAIAGADGQVEYLLTVFDDVTDIRRTEGKLAYMAHHDALTTLPNRALFGQHLNQAIARVKRRGENFAVLSLDLDRFKQVNDTLGHHVGDRLLCEVARRLRDCSRDTDLVARFGGDEFVVLQGDMNQPEGAGAMAQRLVEVIGAPYEIDGQCVLVGASVGIALSPNNGDSAEELLRNADLALYRSKAEGKGTFRFFATEMDEAMQKRRMLEIDLRDAVASNAFEAYFQPLVDVRTGATVACETLVRWRHPIRGFISPAEFIPLAEETGSIVAIGEMILRQACRAAVDCAPHTRVAVNLSAVQFRSGDLFNTVSAALAESGLAADRLELEITESVLIQDSEGVLRVLQQLRALGVHISLDDFGTGYSSLSYLSSFPFDKIKIDRSFVQNVASRPDSAAIVSAIMGLAGTLGMCATAEGVETREELEWLRAHGCPEAQGFLFSKAVSATDIREFLKLAPKDLTRLDAVARVAA